MIAISLILSLCVLSSLPSLFTIFAFLIIEIFRKKRASANRFILFFSPIFITFIFLYFSTLLPSKSSFLTSYWQSGFITFDFNKILNIIKTNLIYYFYPNKFVFLIFILTGLGLFQIIKNTKNRNNLLLTNIFLLVIVASILQLYPIMQRVSLYLTPILIIFISKNMDNVSLNTKIRSILIVLFYIISFNSYNITYLKQITKIPDYAYDARSSMKYLSDVYNNNLIIVNAASDSEFIYYSAYYNLSTNNYVFVQTPNKDQNTYFAILNHIPKEQNVWFYYVNDYSHSPVIVFLNDWAKNKNILNKKEYKNSLILYLKT